MPVIPFFQNQTPVPDAPIGPRMDPSVAAQSSDAITRAAGQFSGAMTDFDAKYQDAKRQSDAAALAADAEGRLGQIQFALSTQVPTDPTTNLPDHTAARTAFDAQAQTLRGQILSGITDPEVQSYVAQHFDRAAIDRGMQTQSAAFGEESSARRGNLDQSVNNYTQALGQTDSDISRARITDQAVGAINGAVMGGWLTPQEGQDRIIRFKSGVAETAVQHALNADPAVALQHLQDPTAYPGLLPDRRESLTYTAAIRADMAERQANAVQEKADRDAERQLRGAQAANAANLIGAAMGGQAIDTNHVADMVRSQQITPEAANAILTARLGHDDPQAAVRLWHDVGAGAATADDIYTALSTHAVSASTGVDMMRALGSRQSQGDNTVERAAFANLRTALGGDTVEKGLVDFGNATQAAMARGWAQAQSEWTNRVLVGHEDPRAALSDLVAKYQPPDHPPVTWARPKFGGVDNQDAVTTVWGQTKAAFQAGQLSNADYQAQAALLNQYRKFYGDLAARQAAAKAAKAPGAKPGPALPGPAAPGSPMPGYGGSDGGMMP